MKVSSKDLRIHTKNILAAADRGEEVLITFRGRPRAMILPYLFKKKTGKRKKPIVFGMWKDRDMDVKTYVQNLRKPRFSA